MTDERKSVRRLLERVGTYTDPATPAPGAAWRDSVLAAIPEVADAMARGRPPPDLVSLPSAG